MGAMHWRSLLGLAPRYAGSVHLVQNERAVTAFEGEWNGAPLRAYVVQIGALTVNGIDSLVAWGRQRDWTANQVRDALARAAVHPAGKTPCTELGYGLVGLPR